MRLKMRSEPTLGAAKQAANAWMRDKGYEVEPRDVVQIEGAPVWYFYYELPDETEVELEVRVEDGRWEWEVTMVRQPSQR